MNHLQPTRYLPVPLLITFFILAFAQQGYSQISIAAARGMSLGTTVTVKGIATCGPELGGVRYMQDGTAGIAVYDPVPMAAVVAGDSIEVTGVLAEFNQLLEVGNGDGSLTLNVLSSGNPLPDPLEIDINTGYTEANEGMLVKVLNATFDDVGAFTYGVDGNYDITDATGTDILRVNDETNIDGTLIPEDPIDMIGLLGQFSFSDPSAGYQLLPRGLFDLLTGGTPPVISTPLTQTNLATDGFTVSFETIDDGNTIINYGATEALGTILTDAANTTSHTMDLSGLSSGTVYYVQGASVSATNDTSYSPITPMATVSESSGEMVVYFNNTVDHSVSTGTNAHWLNLAMDDSLIAFIDGAQSTLDIAIYNMDNNLGVVDAINDAFTRGVAVRLIANDDVNAGAYSDLSIGSGNKRKSPPTSSSSFGFMHNKFIIRDAESADPNECWVWTGSTNWTANQLTDDPNNAILIQDQTIARVYTLEFEEMWSGVWNEDKTANTPTEFIVGGNRVEVYFAPTDNVEDRIDRVIQQAEHDIHFAVFNWTRFGISYEVEDAVNAGAFAAGIIDDINDANIEWTILNDAMPGTLFRSTVHSILHHKYLISDAQCPASDPMVMTGSSNFSGNGTARSDENIVIVHNADIANQYYQEFVARYAEVGGTEFSVADVDCEVVEPMGIAEVDIELLTIYPNPATDLVQIQIPSGFVNGEVMLYDISGRIVKSFELNGQTLEQIDISDLGTGLYTVRMLNAEQNIAAGQLMKVN